MAWTDERLQERFDAIDHRFDAIDGRFDRVEAEIVSLRQEMQAGFAILQSGLNRTWISIVAGLFGVIAAILVKGG